MFYCEIASPTHRTVCGRQRFTEGSNYTMTSTPLLLGQPSPPSVWGPGLETQTPGTSLGKRGRQGQASTECLIHGQGFDKSPCLSASFSECCLFPVSFCKHLEDDNARWPLEYPQMGLSPSTPAGLEGRNLGTKCSWHPAGSGQRTRTPQG